ncbi:MAG: tagaturonate epimerase family protein [Candidatus Bathyarchaeota archaeon]|nr:tagaturonate epimerase family protein [Candidatus Bathyarchaeota archaeon]
MSIETPRYIGSLPHPAFGIRIPDIVLPGILRSLKEHRVAAGFMLSFGRETAPRYVVDAAPGLYHITTGHTGTSITEYIEKASSYAVREGVVVEVEADHLILGATTAEAVSRIIGAGRVSERRSDIVEASIKYNLSEVDEAVETSRINAFTVDACSLIDFSANDLSGYELDQRFEESIPESGDRIRLIEEYTGRSLAFPWIDGRCYHIKFTVDDVKKLAVKYIDSLKATWRIYSYIDERMEGKPFGFEIAFDETPTITPAKDLYYYLMEWRRMGAHAEFIAPNIGFEKRMDYRGNLDELRSRVSMLAAVAYSLGTTLSIHSTSGFTPTSMKGARVYETLRLATGGRIKTKISGIYYELLLEILYSSPPGSRRRRIYEELFDTVVNYLEDEVKSKGPLYSDELVAKLDDYKRSVKEGRIRERDPLSTLAKSYLFIALNIRDERGRRYIRDAIIELYEEDAELRRIYDLGVASITDSIIEKFGFQDNVKLLS